MKSTTASLIISALASMVIAQPRHGHQHPARAAHQHDQPAQKRAVVTEWAVEWVTETVTEYIDATTTALFYPDPSTTLATVKTSASAGEFHEESSSVYSAPSSSSTYVAPPAPTTASSSTSEAYVAPPAPTTTSISTSAAYVPPPPPAPATTESSTSEVYVAPEPTTAPTTAPVEVPTTAPAVETPTTTSSAAAVVVPTTPAAAPGGGASPPAVKDDDAAAVLGPGFSSGDITYYTLGLGSCGVNNLNEDMSANIVAMSAETMGAVSNGNPMCGRTIKIYNPANGKTSTGIIQDKCPGCAAGSIDVSQKLFEEVADLSKGRVPITWNWA